MLHLEFTIVGPRFFVPEPAAAFRFDTAGVTALPGRRPVAQFSGRMWKINGQFFSSCRCREPARVQFEDDEGNLADPVGPLESLALYGGSLYAGKTLLARFDEGRRVWHRASPEADYAAIVISA
ncbi:MAG TPA: hypothetical protein VKZ85_07190 [Woeseiaceae bacterium]|nr:hypothetical protein [Woeseiaceae bacterium]